LHRTLSGLKKYFKLKGKKTTKFVSNQIKKVNLLHYNDGTATQISNEGIFHKMELERKRKRAIIREVLS
jgi:hypothetical protein